MRVWERVSGEFLGNLFQPPPQGKFCLAAYGILGQFGLRLEFVIAVGSNLTPTPQPSMSIRPMKLIAAGLLALMVGEATAQAGGPAVGASPIPRDTLSNTTAAAASVAVAAALGMWLSSHTAANH